MATDVQHLQVSRLPCHAADFQALLIDYRKKVNVMKKTTNAVALASIMRATEKDLE
jgi:hypothetical protein